MLRWIDVLAGLARGHITEIAISITAMSLVVTGPHINRAAMDLTRALHWLARYALFVVLATAGYGLLTHFGVQFFRRLLRGLDNLPLLAAIVGSHLVMAWLLKREKHI
jgi:hypothetical protein